MLLPYRNAALAMLGLMMIGVSTELAPPKLQQYLVDRILHAGQDDLTTARLLSSLLVVVLALAFTRVTLGIVNYFKGRLATRVGVALTFDLRSRLVQKLHSLGVGYYDRHQVGSLTSRVAYDSEVIHSLLNQITGGFLLQIVQVIAVGLMLFTLNPKLALLTLIPAPLVVGGSWFFWRRVYPRYYRYWDSSSKQAGSLTGMLSGIRVVKAFAQEEREYDRFNRSSDYLRNCRISVENSTAGFSSVMQLVFSLGGLIVWYVGGRDVLDGQMTLGSLMAFLAYLGMFYAPMATLSQLTTWLTSFMTGCQRVFELLDTPVETREPASPVGLGEVRGVVTFDHVTFGYDRHHPVLKDVNFQIRPGETVGVVGRSGSGKTTLVNLICRFYDVTEGSVKIDGVDVRDLAPSELRRHVGVVLQDPFQFRGTIWENLVYGDPNATCEQAVTAAKAAQAHDFILRTPLGYDTWLGERGAGLSGGERQRLSIARALLYDPKILILDEATSSVDTESEKAIQDALKVLARGRTTIAIAHRLTTLRDSHRILVFDQGRLIEHGSHAELMKLDGQYAQLVKIQTQLSSDASVDVVFSRRADPSAEPTNGEPDRNGHPEKNVPQTKSTLAEFEPRWLDPGDATLYEAQHGTLGVQIGDGPRHRGVFAVGLFPASNPDGFVSLRVWDKDGRETELGIVRDLGRWPSKQADWVRAALARRYFLYNVVGIDSIKLDCGYLTLAVRTSHGPRTFTMRWSQSQVQEFGSKGKVLVDLEDNRYIVRDVSSLPRTQRDLFLRFIYW
jgi:ATP-binding cassette subfamily B protein